SAGARLERWTTASRFRRTSFAKSGIRERTSSSFVVISGLRSEGLAADRAVARTQLVGLQAVEDTQRLVGVAADVQVVHRDVLDRVVRVDDESRTQRDAFVPVADAELVDQRTCRVGELPLVQVLQVGMLAT